MFSYKHIGIMRVRDGWTYTAYPSAEVVGPQFEHPETLKAENFPHHAPCFTLNRS